VTGTVTAFRRELRGSGSFMDTDPAKIRGALTALPAELWGRSLTGGSRKNGTGVSLTFFVALTRAREGGLS
jgi:hypothetical protein